MRAVTQEVQLFNSTVLDNVALYDPTVDDTAVLGRLIGSADPALAGCARSAATNQACNTGTWTFIRRDL